jgi:flagellar motility protein MotE (MotC chaperone)
MNRALRLLPAVVVLGAGLLALKGVDIARAAQSAAVTDQDEPDNTGLAPGHVGGGLPGKDFAGEDAAAGSAATVDVMGSFTRRRAELDARERALVMRENVLKAGESRVDQKIADIKALQAQMQSLLTQRDAKQDAQIASLVKTYSAMKPKDAARIFNSLADNVLLPVAKGMKSDVLAPVMAAMNSDAAQRLTEKLAALLKLPESSSTICPANIDAADAAPPVSVAAAATPAAPIPAAMLAPPPIAATITPNITPTATTPAAPVAAPTPVPAGPEAPVAPKPHKAVEHHPAPAKPVAAVVTPAKPVATTPAKPATTAAVTPGKPEPAPAPPVKATIIPAAPPAAAPVTTAAATTPATPPVVAPVTTAAPTAPTKPAAPQVPATTAPTPITPAKSN